MQKFIRNAAMPILWLLLALSAGCTTLNLPAPGNGFSPQRYAARLAEAPIGDVPQLLSQAEAAWQQQPSAENRARLGLARGRWGHSGYAPSQAAVDLRAALSEADGWPAQQRDFLAFQAAQLEHIGRRESRFANARIEHEALRRQLREAEDKLRAISDIERDLGRQP